MKTTNRPAPFSLLSRNPLGKPDDGVNQTSRKLHRSESSILPVCLMRLHEHPRSPILRDEVEHLLRLLLFYGSNWIQSPGAEEPLCSCHPRSVSRLFAISVPVLNRSERFPECVFKRGVSTKSSNGANQVGKWNPWHRGTRPSCSASPGRGSSPQE